MAKINLGTVRFTDRGDWAKDYSFTSEVTGETVTGYLKNDIVHTSKGIYGSLVDNNTAAPDTDDGTNWRTWLSIAGATEATGAANEAAADANKQAEKASAAASSANAAAANESAREQAETERKAAETQRASDFQALSDNISAQLKELKRVQEAIENAQSVAPMASVPASIYVETERSAAVGETVNIAPSLFAPSTCNKSVIFKVYEGNGKVNYKGDVLLPSEAGDTIVEVIPTLNHMAAKVVTIHATALEALTDPDGEEILDENEEAVTA